MFLSIYDTHESEINILISNRLFTILFINILCFLYKSDSFFYKKTTQKHILCDIYRFRFGL